MTKKKSTKRALLLSALSLLMCVSMLIGSTFAWFTDSVTSGNNKIVAGNLDVALYHTNGTDTNEEVTNTTMLFDEVALWEPGAMVWEKLTVKNLGSLALKYTLSVNVSDISVVDGKSLADVLKVAVMTEQPTRENIKTATKQPLETFALKGEGVLAAETGVDEFYVAIYWAPTANDNDYNVAGEQLYATLGVNLLATQATVEKDSFDEQYDADASFDDVIFANGGTYEMDAERNEGITISSGATVVINGEGNTINNSAAGLINEGNVTVNDVVMNAGSTADYSNINRDGAVAEYNNVDINSAGGGVGAVGGAQVTFNSGSVEVDSKSTSGRYLFYADGEGSVITINGGSFDFNKTQNQKRAYIYAANGATVYVNGGTFGKASSRSGYTAGILTGDNGTVIITGGTFGFDPTTWVASGYKAEKVGTNWIVIPASAVIAADDAALDAAISAGESAIYLMDGDYTADLYSVAPRDSLTIVGNGAGTKLAFNNLQVRASQFKNLTISNCTVERMPDKSWGHLVFGSSTQAGGVYTISNCTFNGVGSQGIYINQNVEATFNIENCTFNGDFGGEGAITVQNNDNVNITVNVTGCAFNNIPETSHEIYILYKYAGWTLNADGVNAFWK